MQCRPFRQIHLQGREGTGHSLGWAESLPCILLLLCSDLGRETWSSLWFCHRPAVRRWGGPLGLREDFCPCTRGQGNTYLMMRLGEGTGDCPHQLAHRKAQQECAPLIGPYVALLLGSPCGTSIPSVPETTAATCLHLPHRELSLERLHGLTEVTKSPTDRGHKPRSPAPTTASSLNTCNHCHT